MGGLEQSYERKNNNLYIRGYVLRIREALQIKPLNYYYKVALFWMVTFRAFITVVPVGPGVPDEPSIW